MSMPVNNFICAEPEIAYVVTRPRRHFPPPVCLPVICLATFNKINSFNSVRGEYRPMQNISLTYSEFFLRHSGFFGWTISTILKLVQHFCFCSWRITKMTGWENTRPRYGWLRSPAAFGKQKCLYSNIFNRSWSILLFLCFFFIFVVNCKSFDVVKNVIFVFCR